MSRHGDALQVLDHLRTALARGPRSSSWGMVHDEASGEWIVLADAVLLASDRDEERVVARCPDEGTAAAIMTLLSTARSAATVLEQAIVRLEAALARLDPDDAEEILDLLAPSAEEREQAGEAHERFIAWLDEVATEHQDHAPLPMPGEEPPAEDRHPW